MWWRRDTTFWRHPAPTSHQVKWTERNLPISAAAAASGSVAIACAHVYVLMNPHLKLCCSKARFITCIKLSHYETYPAHLAKCKQVFTFPRNSLHSYLHLHPIKHTVSSKNKLLLFHILQLKLECGWFPNIATHHIHVMHLNPQTQKSRLHNQHTAFQHDLCLRLLLVQRWTNCLY